MKKKLLFLVIILIISFVIFSNIKGTKERDMSLTINIYYTGENGNARKFAEEMEQSGTAAAIMPENVSISNYDTIYLGFPIWWGTAPVIVRTFLEKYDFSSKKIIIFATSGSSGIGNIDKDLKTSVSGNTNIVKGAVLNNNPSVEYLKEWSQTFK